MNQLIYKERKNTDSEKWDGLETQFGAADLLPLWVADMDFEAPVCVKEALKEYVDFGVFGYYRIPETYQEAFIKWEEAQHDYRVKSEWMRVAPGVVPAFNWLIQILTQEEESVIIMPPVYYPFRNAIINNNRKLVESQLLETEQGYVMDYADFEEKIKQHGVKLFIFCSPHNPVGRVWKRDEIKQILDICKRHGVYVIADEIHQDLIMPGYKHIPAASTGDYDDILVTLTAATKTFNLAGCQNSIVIIPDEGLRSKFDKFTLQLQLQSGNAFGYIAVQSAYEHGRPWLDELLKVIYRNYRVMKDTLLEHLPDARVADLEGTYLMWVDLGKYLEPGQAEAIIQGQCGLAVDYGSWFGSDDYAGYIRINLATREENIRLAAERIVKALKK